MNILSVICIGATMMLGAMIALNAQSNSEIQHSPFVSACDQSMKSAARSAVQKAKSQGKNIAFFKRFLAASAINSTCRCTHTELETKYGEDDLLVAGKMIGFTVKSSMIDSIDDRSERRRARRDMRANLKVFANQNNMSYKNFRNMSYKVNRTMSRCLKKFLS